MINTFKNAYKVNLITSFNSFIYYLKKIPLIKKVIPSTFYEKTDLKLSLGFLITIKNIITGTISKLLYLFLVIYIPLSMFKALDNTNYLINIIIFLSFIISSFGMPKVFDTTKEKYQNIVLMRFNPKDYLIVDFLFDSIQEFLLLIPSLLIFSLFIKYSFIKLLVIAFMLLCSRLIGNAFNLMIYDKFSIMISKKWQYNVPLIGFGIVLAYLPIIFQVKLNYDFIFSYGLLIIIILGFISLKYILSFNKYKKLVRELLVKEMIFFDNKEIKVNASFNYIKLKDEDQKLEKNHDNEFGYEYLNSIFYDRHKRLLKKPIIRTCVVITAIFLLGLISIFVFPDIKLQIKDAILNKLGIVIFIMYFIAGGEKACKMFFYNCDHSLLAYKFYRKPKVVMDNFKVRLKMILKLNLAPALIVATSLVIFLALTSNSSIITYITLFLSIIFIAFFFTVHNLFLYYILQPYDIDLINKSFAYKLINGLTYWFCYTISRISIDFKIFSVLIIILTFIYIVIALLAINKYAYKTFKIK